MTAIWEFYYILGHRKTDADYYFSVVWINNDRERERGRGTEREGEGKRDAMGNYWRWKL